MPSVYTLACRVCNNSCSNRTTILQYGTLGAWRVQGAHDVILYEFYHNNGQRRPWTVGQIGASGSISKQASPAGNCDPLISLCVNPSTLRTAYKVLLQIATINLFWRESHEIRFTNHWILNRPKLITFTRYTYKTFLTNMSGTRLQLQ